MLTENSRNTLVHDASPLVSLVCVENIVAVGMPDAVWVAKKSCGQDVKNIVSALSNQNVAEYVLHPKVCGTIILKKVGVLNSNVSRLSSKLVSVFKSTTAELSIGWL